jgi:hypothetical protein
MLGSLRPLHHSQTCRIHSECSSFIRLFGLSSSLHVVTALLARLGFLLLLAFALLHFEFSLLDTVAGALVVQFLVLGCDFGFAGFAVAAASCTVGWC